MFSARAVLRATSKAASSRILLTARTISYVRPAISALRPAGRMMGLQTRAAAPFSISARLQQKMGTVDEELAEKLQSELLVEKEVKNDAYPDSVKEFLASGDFNVIDKPGHQEVELVRKFGDETIKIRFSISDLNALDDGEVPEEEYEDGAESDNMQSGGAQSKQAREDGTVPVDNSAAEEAYSEEQDEPTFPARLNITIEKPNQGVMEVQAVAQEGMILIDNVEYFKSAQLAAGNSAEIDWEKRGLYGGPPFANLDEDLQVLLERYLDERGINTSLAVFVPDYIDMKEQKEYISWLENVKNFVSA